VSATVSGTDAAASAQPDGYPISLATDGPITIAPTLHKKPLPYDWKRDFQPLSLMAVGYQILLSSPKLAAGNLKEFVALAKAQPGNYNFASIGVGSAPHLSAEYFLSLAGLKLTHVPYRGSSQQAIAALISGDVEMFVVGTSTAVPFVKAATVRGLAVTAPKRLDSLPDIPTLIEVGLPGFVSDTWNAISAPPKTPAPIIAKLNRTINDIINEPDTKARFRELNLMAAGGSPQDMAKLKKEETERWTKVIRDAGIQPE